MVQRLNSVAGSFSRGDPGPWDTTHHPLWFRQPPSFGCLEARDLRSASARLGCGDTSMVTQAERDGLADPCWRAAPSSGRFVSPCAAIPPLSRRTILVPALARGATP